MKPDLATMRRVPWLPATALVLADLMDHDGHEEVRVSPRAILKRQVARARAMGFEPMMATELEFYIFENSYENLRDGGPAALKPISGYNEDYHIFQTTKEEGLMRAVRNGLYGAGIPVENTKGEADAGQHEVNYKYSDALDTADNHVIVKQAVKEIAHAARASPSPSWPSTITARPGRLPMSTKACGQRTASPPLPTRPTITACRP
jgi:glutamine synthetase